MEVRFLAHGEMIRRMCSARYRVYFDLLRHVFVGSFTGFLGAIHPSPSDASFNIAFQIYLFRRRQPSDVVSRVLDSQAAHRLYEPKLVHSNSNPAIIPIMATDSPDFRVNLTLELKNLHISYARVYIYTSYTNRCTIQICIESEKI